MKIKNEKVDTTKPISGDQCFGQEITVVHQKDVAKVEEILTAIANQNGESVAWQQQPIDGDKVAIRYRFFKEETAA